MSSDLSLGGLDLGITLDEMHNRLGQESSSKQDGNHMYYFYEGLKVGSVDNKLTSLVSENDEVKTKRGIHQGSTLDEVVSAYGNPTSTLAYDGKTLYEYTFPPSMARPVSCASPSIPTRTSSPTSVSGFPTVRQRLRNPTRRQTITPFRSSILVARLPYCSSPRAMSSCTSDSSSI